MKNNITFALRAPMHAIAVATILALVAWTIGLPSWIHTASASTLGSFKDTISDSDLTVNAAHRVKFTTPNGLVGSETMVVTFDPTTTGFDLTGFTTGDISIVSGATKVANLAACGAGANEMYITNGPGEAFTFSVCNDVGENIASSTTFIIDFGTTTGGNLINNPATEGSYVIRVNGTMQDSGDTRIAIIDDVTVSATVNTIFTFSINGVAGGVTVNNDVTTTFASSTATTVPYGIIAPGTAKLMAQELRVDTNALNGFSVTVFADQTLTAGNGATIDEFVNGNAISSSTLWAGPASTLGNTDTYGHWGLTSDDNVVSSTTANLWGTGPSAYVGNFINNPIEVFYHNTAVTTAQGGMGVGSTTVAYKVEIGNLQEAATDYRATLTYIATPVF